MDFGDTLISPDERAAVEAFAAEHSGVPEPSAVALLSVGAAGLLLRRHRTGGRPRANGDAIPGR